MLLWIYHNNAKSNIYLLALQSLTAAQNYLIPENFILRSAKQVPCIHSASIFWGMRVFTSPDMVQLSPQLNCVSGGIKLSNFCTWQPNPTALHRCMLAQCFNARLKFLFYQENLSSPVAGMELEVPGCGMQGAATPQCAIIFCALSSRSVLFHVFYCVMIFLLWDGCTLCGRNCDCLNGPTELSESSPHCISTTWFFLVSHLLPVCNLCVFSYTNSILDNHSASFISFQWLPTFLPLLKVPQNEW